MAAWAQYVGLVLFAVGVGLLVGSWVLVAGVGCSLIVLGVGVLAFGVAAEREVTDGSSSTAARPQSG
jgi:protein-S-isoprenylcysteine O-methyltransferase Ste14